LEHLLALRRLLGSVEACQAGLSRFDLGSDYNEGMFARKIRVEYEENGSRHPCPLQWMDSFSMRNFTNASVFDDTLPVADGVMEIGARVPTDTLREAMQDWFRRKSYLPTGAKLLMTNL
jgi:hypothetical protein